MLNAGGVGRNLTGGGETHSVGSKTLFSSHSWRNLVRKDDGQVSMVSPLPEIGVLGSGRQIKKSTFVAEQSQSNNRGGNQ